MTNMTTRPTAESLKALSEINRAAWKSGNIEEMIVRDRAATKPKPRATKQSKMRNKRVQTPQGAFSSVREWRRYGELLLLEKSGVIELGTLRRQEKFAIDVEDVHICYYISDFSYRLTKGLPNGDCFQVEDVKPNFKTEASRKRYQATLPYRMFLMKKRLMLAIHGIDVREV